MTENKMPESCSTKAKSFWSDFYAAPCFLLKIFSLAIILGLATFGLYKIVTSAFHYFNEPLSYFDPERLGQLGDFLGGTLNPIFGFATVCLLLWSVFIQRKELSLTRDELKKSATALDKQVNISTNEYNRKQLESTIDELQKRYSEILNESFPQIMIIYEDVMDTHSMPEKITKLIELMRIMAHKKGDIKQPTNILDKLKKNDTSFTSEIIRNANTTFKMMINLFEDLIKITKEESVKEYWRFRAKTLIDQACLVEILDTDEKDQLYIKIGLYS